MYSNNSNNWKVPLHDALEQRRMDQRMIDEFLSETLNFESKGKSEDTKTCRIIDVKSKLFAVDRLNKEVKALGVLLKSKEWSDEEWNEQVKICEEKKKAASEILRELQDPQLVENFKKTLDKRKAKRLRQRNRQNQWKLEKSKVLERREQLHRKIDAWIREKQNAIDQEKQNESLRRDADLVLSDVRNKKTDAKKFQQILQELKNLRRIRVNVARARGENPSQEAEETFNNIIDKLSEQWKTLDQEYSIEEHGLKLMLQSDEAKKIEKENKNIFWDWEVALFGRKIASTNLSHGGLNGLVVTRMAWDSFVSNAEVATSIPIGWVMPDVPSSDAWQLYTKH